jgi:[protein-PII] uridylyltransferase
LQELYRRTLDAFEQDKPPQLDVAQQRQRLMRQLKEDIPDEDLRRFVDSLPPYYLSSTDPKLMKLHYSLVRKAEHGEPTVESFDQPEWSATDITVCTSDQPGLLSRILGVLYAFDLSVTAIRACTTESQPPVALDTFTVTHAGNPVPAATRASLSSSILAVITGQQTVDSILQSRGKDPDRSQEVFSFTFTPGVPGVLEVRAPRGRGMPYRFSRLIASQGWNTYAARVGQWADSGAATFYIAGPSGRALSRQEIESTLRPIRTA